MLVSAVSQIFGIHSLSAKNQKRKNIITKSSYYNATFTIQVIQDLRDTINVAVKSELFYV